MFSANVDVEKIVSAVQSCFDLTTPPAWTVTKVQDSWWQKGENMPGTLQFGGCKLPIP